MVAQKWARRSFASLRRLCYSGSLCQKPMPSWTGMRSLSTQPLLTARTRSPRRDTAAIVQLAVFEAVNSITGDYRPYLGSIVAPRGASANAAAIEAAYQVLHAYFPGSASTLDAARTNSLALIPDGDAKTNGIATGDAAAAAMIALRANDGSSPAQFKVPGPPVPGEYQATPSCPIVNGVAVGAFFHWQNVTPFGIQTRQ